MHPLVWLVAFLALAAAACLGVYFSRVGCPSFGHGCTDATPMPDATPVPAAWTGTPTPFAYTGAPTVAPWTPTAAPWTPAPATTAPYTQLLPGQVTLPGVQPVAPLPAFGSAPFQYTLSLWLQVPTVSAKWRTVVRFGPDNNHRAPALFVWPGNTNLHYRHATTADYNPGFDVIPGVAPNTWAHFAMSVSGRVMTPYVNGVAGTALTAAADLVLPMDKVYFYPPVDGTDTTTPMNVADVRFYATALAPDAAAALYKNTRPAL